MAKKNPIDGIYNRLVSILNVEAWRESAVRRALTAAYRKGRKGRKDVEFELGIAYKSAYPPVEGSKEHDGIHSIQGG